MDTRSRFENILKKSLVLDDYFECAICLLEFEDKDQISVVACNPDKQGHGFHTFCLDEWMLSQKDDRIMSRGKKLPRCPMCRVVIKEEFIRKKYFRSPV